MHIKEVIIGRAGKYNCYIETSKTEGLICFNCIRWRFSFPYTCNDYEMYSDKAGTCLNYDISKDAKVD